MSEPIQLSDSLIFEARARVELTDRSVAGQIEYWAQLGRALDPLLNSDLLKSLKISGEIVTVPEMLSSIVSPEGRQRLESYLATQPYPHYQPAVDRPGWFVRIEENGTRTLGKFVGRSFQAAPDIEPTSEHNA